MNTMYRLVNRSELGPMQYEPHTDIALGFDIINPNRSKVHIDLSQYSKHGMSIAYNNQLKQSMYDIYAFLAENVPAATPLFESNAKTYPKGFVLAQPEQHAVLSTMRYLPSGMPDKRYPVIISGNLLADDRVYKGQVHSSTQPSEGGTWYQLLIQEVVLHEHCHASLELQEWSPHAIADYKNSIRNKVVPAREYAPIDFVNETLRKPRGQVPRDPQDYFMTRPDNANKGVDFPLNPELLKLGPIPQALRRYTKPELIELDELINFNRYRDQLSQILPVRIQESLFTELKTFNSFSDQLSVLSKVYAISNTQFTTAHVQASHNLEH